MRPLTIFGESWKLIKIKNPSKQNSKSQQTKITLLIRKKCERIAIKKIPERKKGPFLESNISMLSNNCY
jgi:hypothetical protein